MKVTKHGIKWILNGNKIRCPECGDFRIFNDDISKYSTGSPEYRVIWRAKLRCETCRCEFEVEREELN